MNQSRRGRNAGGYVLCVDDDKYLTDLLSFALEREGYTVKVANRGAQAVQLIEDEPPEAVILDVNLPDANGFSVCMQIRRHHTMPIILLTSRNADEDVMSGFRQGADDYVAKPFNMQVLLYRLRAVMKRAHALNARQRGDERLFQIGEATFDAEFNQVMGPGGPAQLTPIEGKILRLLLANAGQVFPADRIMELVWGYDAESTVAAVKTHMRRLRQKLETVAGPVEVIHTVPGMGYTYRPGLSLVPRTPEPAQEDLAASGVVS